jgi:hypothetical protein
VLADAIKGKATLIALSETLDTGTADSVRVVKEFDYHTAG